MHVEAPAERQCLDSSVEAPVPLAVTDLLHDVKK